MTRTLQMHTKITPSKAVKIGPLLCACLALFSFLTSPMRGISAQVAALTFQARVLTSQELNAVEVRLKLAPVPRAAAPLQFDPRQIFAIDRDTKPVMYFIPVRYNSYDTEVPTHTSYRCGVFILPAEGTAKFFPTIGYGDSEPIQCRETKAVGFLNLQGPDVPPTTFVIYRGNSPNAETGGVVVFSWSAAKNEFAEDEKLEESLTYDPRTVDAQSVRRQLLRKRTR